VRAVQPRTRTMLFVLLILLLCALTLHLVGMPDHHAVGMAIGACLAVLISLDMLRVPSMTRTGVRRRVAGLRHTDPIVRGRLLVHSTASAKRNDPVDVIPPTGDRSQLTRSQGGHAVKKMMLLPVLAAVTAPLAACSSGSDGSTTSDADVRAIQIRTLATLAYSSSRTTVIAGETVRFVVTNPGTTTHEFVVRDEDVQLDHEDEMRMSMDHGSMARDLPASPACHFCEDARV
jgi:plastocyanin